MAFNCNTINWFVKDEVNAVLEYTKTVGHIEDLKDIASIEIIIDEEIGKPKSITILEAVDHILRQEASHVFIWKAIGKALDCSEPVMSREDAEKLGEALETIGEMLEKKGLQLVEKGEVLEEKGEELEKKAEHIEEIQE
jgi:hypothetical protein